MVDILKKVLTIMNRRGLKVYTMKTSRLFTYLLIFSSSLFLLYSCLIRFGLTTQVKKKSVNLQHVTVHFDLKGSPPKLSYMADILPILSNYGVNSILMEYEDMFPYVDSIVNVSSKNSYKRNELLWLINKTSTLNMEVIPLVQTFGHMQFVLKLPEFAHLRELTRNEADICPSNPLSRNLITTILKQVIDLHATVKPLKHIHIGCDEVFLINKCKKCKNRKLKTIDLFVNHVKEVVSIVKELSPMTKVLIWGDMLLQMKKPQTFNLNDVEAVAWDYDANSRFSHKYFYNLHKNFKNIWIASAFKGADGLDAIFPNIKKRFQNHLSWLKFILDYKFGGEKRLYNFEGIILTGWSRYNHTAPQCELLPVAMPSLILNLLLIKTVRNGIDKGDLGLHYCAFFKKYLSKEFREIFPSYVDTNKKCAFENTLFSMEQEKLFNTTLLENCLSNLHTHESECRSIVSYSNVPKLHNSFALCNKALEELANTEKKLEAFMVPYYKYHVITSYIDQIVQGPTQKVKEIMDHLQFCARVRFGNKQN